MDNHSENHGVFQKPSASFSLGVLIIRSFIRRLISLVRLTEQDLKDAGVYPP